MMAAEVVSAVAAWLDHPLVHMSYFCPFLADLPVSHQLYECPSVLIISSFCLKSDSHSVLLATQNPDAQWSTGGMVRHGAFNARVRRSMDNGEPWEVHE